MGCIYFEIPYIYIYVFLSLNNLRAKAEIY